MQDNVLFGPFETAQSMSWRWSTHPENGDQGVMLLPEVHVLRGTNYVPDMASDNFPREGPKHDDDYWPQHFLLVGRRG